jgi:dTDP-4-dehydrorhamnose 3,5-epimerase-like enzyme
MKNKEGYHFMIELKEHGDFRGNLQVIEAEKNIPFPIRRIFYQYNNDVNASRGNHANRNSRFGFVCVSGECSVKIDDGKDVKTYVLDSPRKLLVIDKMIWKEMYGFSDNSVLLVVSDCLYDSFEYIYDYSEFVKSIDCKKLLK